MVLQVQQQIQTQQNEKVGGWHSELIVQGIATVL